LQASCGDGDAPQASLLMDGLGALYGTASGGGPHNAGVVFKLTANGSNTGWSEAILHSFCSMSGCADGQQPWSNVIMDASGNLYGTTSLGGTQDAGTIFKLAPNGSKTLWTETVLHSFCTEVQGSTCLDGEVPYDGLIMVKSGNIYGTTSS